MAITETVVFVGPSVAPLGPLRPQHGWQFRPPVRRGDIKALLKLSPPPAQVAIVDGLFHQTFAVTHREILEAIAQGVTVWGASSLGALRAVELRAAGMRGTGWVYKQYRRQPRRGDDEVALAHMPSPPYQPCSDPLVNIAYALELLRREGLLSRRLQHGLLRRQRRLFFVDRLFATTAAHYSQFSGDEFDPSVHERIRTGRLWADIKKYDAIGLLRSLGYGYVPC